MALTTAHRQYLPGDDTWEHHRDLKALTENFWNPGNPTYDSDLPSMRYSPFSVSWALFSIASGIDSYNVLTLAAILNTLLLCLGLSAFLKAWHQANSAIYGLLAILFIHGSVRGYSTITSLYRLPYAEACPSAFSLALVFFCWALLKRFGERGWKDWSAPLLWILTSIVLLDHAMTAVFGGFGLLLSTLFSHRSKRNAMLGCLVPMGIVNLAAALLWPWYNFFMALTAKLPSGLITSELELSLMQWCVPAFVGALFVLPCANSAFMKLCLTGGLFSYAMGLIILLLPKDIPLAGVMNRVPLQGMIFSQLAIGIYLGGHRIYPLIKELPSIWDGKNRISDRFKILAGWVCLGILGAGICLQVGAVSGIIKPLAPLYLAPINGTVAGPGMKTRLDLILTPVATTDVVFSDLGTSWWVPSSSGRIVFGVHPEIFVPHQGRRREDLLTFFDAKTSRAHRLALLERYRGRWILINKQTMGPLVTTQFYKPQAVVREDDMFALVDAHRWKTLEFHSKTKETEKNSTIKEAPDPAP